jgi:hypothetical protein
MSFHTFWHSRQAANGGWAKPHIKKAGSLGGFLPDTSHSGTESPFFVTTHHGHHGGFLLLKIIIYVLYVGYDYNTINYKINRNFFKCEKIFQERTKTAGSASRPGLGSAGAALMRWDNPPC